MKHFTMGLTDCLPIVYIGDEHSSSDHVLK